MGLGDEIMVTALLKKNNVKEKTLIVDNSRRPRWYPVWNHHPIIIDPCQFTERQLQGVNKLVNCPGHRHYVANNGRWQEWGIIPGEIFLTDKEKSLYSLIKDKNYIVIDPHSKTLNKDWGWYNFEAIVKALPQYNFVQCIYNRDSKPIIAPNIVHIEIRGLRQFLSVVYNSAAVVCNEGGLHHTAAAFGKTAYVIFGAYIRPDVTGYSFHYNFTGGGDNCQRLKYCKHCRDALNRISPEAVIQKILETKGINHA